MSFSLLITFQHEFLLMLSQGKVYILYKSGRENVNVYIYIYLYYSAKIVEITGKVRDPFPQRPYVPCLSYQ